MNDASVYQPERVSVRLGAHSLQKPVLAHSGSYLIFSRVKYNNILILNWIQIA